MDVLAQLQAQIAAAVASAYAQGVLDGKAQSPDLGAALAADHEHLALVVAGLIGKDAEAVKTALAAIAADVQAAVVPPPAPPAA